MPSRICSVFRSLVEVERVVAALAADAADADAAERRGEVADQERVGPHGAGADGAPDAIGPLLASRCRRCRQPVARWSSRARPPPPRRRRSGTSAPGRTPRAARSRSRCYAARPASARTTGRRRASAWPPRTIRSPFARARSTKPSTRARWSGWIIGETVVASSRGIAQHVLVGEPVEALQERVGDRLLDQQPRARQAHLAGVVVLARRLARRGVQVGVGEHDQRALAAQLGRERDDVAPPRRRRCGAPVSGEPVKLMRRTPRVGDQRRADLLADALHDVEHAGREARLVGQVGQHRAGRAATTPPASARRCSRPPAPAPSSTWRA